MRRNGTAVWNGTGKEGTGHLTTQSTVLNKTQYSFGSRFENGIGTNPEELLAAAHAGCYTMQLSFTLNAAGFTADEIETQCYVTIDNGTITKSELTVRAKIPNIDADKFHEAAVYAKDNCPVSKLFNCEKVLDAALV